MDSKAIKAGIGATIVFILLSAIFGTFGGWAPIFEVGDNQITAWLVALFLGVVVAYIYGYLFHKFLPGTAAVKGVVFGILVWILMLIVGSTSPELREAAYPESVVTQTLFLTLIAHVIWGAVLGLIYDAE